VGIGFGLKEIVANFIAGLILLFERPLRVGDILSVGADHYGEVSDIAARATTVRMKDQREGLVPSRDEDRIAVACCAARSLPIGSLISRQYQPTL